VPVEGGSVPALKTFADASEVLREFFSPVVLKHGNHGLRWCSIEDPLNLRVADVLLTKTAFRLKPVIRIEEQDLVWLQSDSREI